MKFALFALLLTLAYFSTVPSVFAQTITTTPTPTETETTSSGNVINSFIAGFDWISGGLVFHTPSILDETIKLNDGTELSGLSKYRTIFYDIAIPLFVLLISGVAFSHITNDSPAQLQAFFKRLVFIVVLFMLTPTILSYSIQFVNLLNEKIIAQNAFNLSTFINDFLSSFMQSPEFHQLFGVPFRIPTWNTVLQLIILVISIGFLLIGFIYIIFQAVIRFIALLLLSVIFPVVLPFALSKRTENIANTYFRTWFTFLIQQPAFVLGFAIVSAILTSIVQAHNASIGTLFIYSGALIFLGTVNVFIGRIFGDGWSLVASNAQSMIGSYGITKSFGEVKRGAITGRATGARSYAGKFLRDIPTKIKQGKQINEEKREQKMTKSKQTQLTNQITEKVHTSNTSQGFTRKQFDAITKKYDASHYPASTNQPETKEKPGLAVQGSQDAPKSGIQSIQKRPPVITKMNQANGRKTFLMQRPQPTLKTSRERNLVAPGGRKDKTK